MTNATETPFLTQRFEDATVYALRLHANQLRKGNSIPYVSHLFAVCGLVLEYGGDEDQAIAALLHDSVEDQGGQERLAEVRARFGDRVAEIVMACSDTDVLPKPPWRERKETYLAHLPEADPSVLLVSAADKLHNARTVLADYREQGEATWSRFNGGREGTLWYYRALVNVYQRVGPRQLAEELDRVVTEVERLAGL